LRRSSEEVLQRQEPKALQTKEEGRTKAALEEETNFQMGKIWQS